MGSLKVLVTGSSSFIGGHVVTTLLNSDIDVSATYRDHQPTFNKQTDKLHNLKLIKIDLTNSASFKLLPKKIDVIIHIAGVSDWDNPSIEDMLMANIMGTRNIQKYGIDAGAKKFIYTSSISVYGKVLESIVSSNTAINDPTIYGLSKLMGEKLIESTSEVLPAIAIRLPGVLGFGAHGVWLSSVINKLKKNIRIDAYGKKNLFNNALHSKDLASFILHLSLQKNWDGYHAFPIAALDAVSIEDLLFGLKESLNSSSEIRFVDNTKTQFTISSEMAINKFGYQPNLIKNIIDSYIKDLTFEK